MRILILSNQVPMPDEQRNMRINTLYNMLVESGHEVTVLTSCFNHYDKAMRTQDNCYDNFNVVLLNERGYKKNISFKRLLSQKDFARNAKKWFLINYRNIDCVFAVVPTYEATYNVGKICNKHNIPLIIDVEDLWPEAMRVVFRNKLIYKALLWPIKRLANKTYSLANSLTAVSQKYLNRAVLSNKEATNNTIVYLGVDSKKFFEGQNKYASTFAKSKNEFWVCYIGTLGTSYDLKTLFDAMKRIRELGLNNVKCKVLGKGPDEETLINYAKLNNIMVDFVGFLDYEKMAGFLNKCDLMVNPIKSTASQSVINKVGDYFASGKPVLNSCTNKEMMELIDNYNVGFNYNSNDSVELSRLIIKLFEDSDLRSKQGENAFALFKERFDRYSSYKTIIKQIEQLSINKRQY